MDEHPFTTAIPSAAAAAIPAAAAAAIPAAAGRAAPAAAWPAAAALMPEQEALRCISDEIARKYNVLPLRIRDGKLHVAMSEPTNVLALDDIRFITKKAVVPVLADASQIARRIDEHFSVSRSARALEDLKQEFGYAPETAREQKAEAANAAAASASASASAAAGASAGDSGDVSGAPAVRLADSLLSQSISMKASDIHLEPYSDSVRVRYRVDGALVEDMAIPPQLYASVSTRVKVMAGMDIAERRLPQDGRIEMAFGGKTYDFRVSSLPTVHGEKIEIRILDRASFAFRREMLGFSERENRIVDRVTRLPYGIVLVTGPTGSGKTTTIYSLLAELNDPSRNIVTIEDPVEYMIRGVNQVQVNQKAGLTFAGGLRSILRQDPDIIMVGEIRDEETADIAVRAAITGHLVFSTLHTNDAPSAITRLTDMGVEPYLISEAVTCVIAQRLVRALCPDCKSGRPADPSEMKLLRLEDAAEVFSPAGCPRCNNIGYKGRRAIHEVLYVDAGTKREIERGRGSEGLRELAVSRGMATLFSNCRGLVLAGATSVQEMANAAYARDESI